jgi:hypothetical protein
MVWSPLPKYFIARAAQDSAASPDETTPLDHVIDCFFTGGRHLAEREWVVATDCLGHLHLLPESERETFPASIQNELAFHEISASSRTRQTRSIEASHIFLFYIQLLEQLAGAPGFNDPVYLYGTLYGPYLDAADAQANEVEGQLAVTRGDILEGLIQGADYVFRYALPRDERGPANRCFHLLLPGGSDEEIGRGTGMILAYPLLPVELRSAGVSNEFIVSQIIYDLLSAIKEDAVREQVEHPLRSLVLPVPSRSLLEQELQSQGYTISGNKAIKKAVTGGEARGLLASIFGSFMNDELDLPREATVDEFLAMAERALTAMPGWPPPRTIALRDRVRSFRNRQHQVSTPLFTPPPTVTPPPRAPEKIRRARPVPTTRRSDEPPAWMQDFIAAHRRPDSPPPKLTSTSVANRREGRRVKGKSSPPPPEWMKDFDQPSSTPQTGGAQRQSGESKWPEWMDDFE